MLRQNLRQDIKYQPEQQQGAQLLDLSPQPASVQMDAVGVLDQQLKLRILECFQGAS